MNIAKMDEIEGIRAIAEQKLSDYKDRITEEEYLTTI